MNNNKFLEELTGYSRLDTLSNEVKFFLIKEWMEKEMPEVWEDYVDHCFVLFRYDKKTAFECLNKALNLENLVTYLSEHREWGVKECKDIGTKGIRTCICWDRPDKEYCNGTGIIKHPALVYLEESCEK